MVFSTFSLIAQSQASHNLHYLWSCFSLKGVQPGHALFALWPEKSMKYFKYNLITLSNRILFSTFSKHVISFKVVKTY